MAGFPTGIPIDWESPARDTQKILFNKEYFSLPKHLINALIPSVTNPSKFIRFYHTSVQKVRNLAVTFKTKTLRLHTPGHF